MANENEPTDNMVVSEGADGSATIDLPDTIPSPEMADGGGIDDNDESDEAAQDREIAATGAIDPDAEAARAAKRNKRRARKDYHKQVQTEKDYKLQNLQRQNQDLLERLAVVERKTAGSELARLDKAIDDQNMRIQFAKQKIKEATETGDGDLLTSAQEMWFEARRQSEDLQNYKQRAVAPPKQQAIQRDPMVDRYAGNWMTSNPWYDPQGSDMDSKITLTVDQALAEEGWDPKTAEYWEELDNRLSKVLPNRYTGDADVKPAVRTRPRSVVTGSGRESAASSGGRNQFTLSPDQVRAMKDAGMWDDPEKRNRMIKRYAIEARNQRN